MGAISKGWSALNALLDYYEVGVRAGEAGAEGEYSAAKSIIKDSLSILERAAIDHANERAIEELEILSDKIPKHPFGGVEIIMIQNIIDYQIANLRDR